MVVLKRPEHLDEITRLNQAAFPQEERLDIAHLARLSESGEFAFLAACDDGRFVGFVFLALARGSVYLLLLAVEESLRSRGYGRAILHALRDQYPDSQIVVDIQPVDAPSDNPEQRKKRRAFYLRSGFHATGWYMVFQGLEFELLCTSSDFDPIAFGQVIQSLNENGFEMKIKPAEN